MPSPITIPAIPNTWTPFNVPLDAYSEAGSPTQPVGLGSARMLTAYMLTGMISVKAYGAKGDGVTNDTTAITNAIAAAIAVGAGCVTFPAGSYLVDNVPIPSVAGRTLMLLGLGKWAVSGSALSRVGARLVSNSAVPIFSPANRADGVKVVNLVLDGNGVGTYGWYGAYGSFTTIEDCCAINFTATGFHTAQGLCNLRFCYSTANGNGATWAGDGRVVGCWLSGNTAGWGLKSTAGGTFVQNCELAFNTYGYYIDGTSGANNSNHNISGCYVEDNSAAGILVSGQNSGNRNVNKVRISNCYVSMIHNVAACYGIQIQYARTVQIDQINLIGAGGSNTNELQGIILTSSDTTAITNVVAQSLARNVIKLVAADDCVMSGISARDCSYSGASTADSYGIYSDATSGRPKIAAVSFTDYRSPGYMRGIFVDPAQVVNISSYSISTSVGTPDSFTGSALYNNSAGSPVVSSPNGLFDSLIGQQNASVKNYTTRGQIVLAGSATGTLFTLDNSSTNRTWILTIRQAGAGTANFGMAMLIAYGANATAATICNDSTNPALQFTWSTTGLAVKVTPGSGYGSTTWDWVLTPLG